MNLLETIKEILLALCIAILLPITLYWGVNIVSKYPVFNDFAIEESSDLKFSYEKIKEANLKLQKENWQKAKNHFDNIVFYTFIISAFILLVMGSLISINSLAMGLIAGGFINICYGLAHNPGIAILNFIIFLSFLIVVIFLTIIKKKNA